MSLSWKHFSCLGSPPQMFCHFIAHPIFRRCQQHEETINCFRHCKLHGLSHQIDISFSPRYTSYSLSDGVQALILVPFCHLATAPPTTTTATAVTAATAVITTITTNRPWQRPHQPTNNSCNSNNSNTISTSNRTDTSRTKNSTTIQQSVRGLKCFHC